MGKIFCIMGKSAAGKDTLYRELLERCPWLRTYVMYTTRPIRAEEIDGKSYHFVTEQVLQDFEARGCLIEKRVYHTVKGPWIYATADDGQIDLSSADYLVLATLESYCSWKAYFGSEHLVPLYIELEDGERLLRAIHREQQEAHPDYREVCRRFLADAEDFSEERLREAGIRERYRNDDREKCLSELAARIRREEQ